jgi:hypothetical protein
MEAPFKVTAPPVNESPLLIFKELELLPKVKEFVPMFTAVLIWTGLFVAALIVSGLPVVELGTPPVQLLVFSQAFDAEPFQAWLAACDAKGCSARESTASAKSVFLILLMFAPS